MASGNRLADRKGPWDAFFNKYRNTPRNTRVQIGVFSQEKHKSSDMTITDVAFANEYGLFEHHGPRPFLRIAYDLKRAKTLGRVASLVKNIEKDDIEAALIGVGKEMVVQARLECWNQGVYDTGDTYDHIEFRMIRVRGKGRM